MKALKRQCVENLEASCWCKFMRSRSLLKGACDQHVAYLYKRRRDQTQRRIIGTPGPFARPPGLAVVERRDRCSGIVTAKSRNSNASLCWD